MTTSPDDENRDTRTTDDRQADHDVPGRQLPDTVVTGRFEDDDPPGCPR